MQSPFPTLEELRSTGVPACAEALRSTGVSPVPSTPASLERPAQATPCSTGVPARAESPRSTDNPVRADLISLADAVSEQPSPPSPLSHGVGEGEQPRGGQGLLTSSSNPFSAEDSTSTPGPLIVNGEGESDARGAAIPPSPFTERGDRGVRLDSKASHPFSPHPQPFSRGLGEGSHSPTLPSRGRGGQAGEGKFKSPFPEYAPPPQPEDAPDLDTLRAEAEAIRLQAIQNAERIREQAQREGYQRGYEQGYAKGEQHARQHAETELQHITENLRAQVEQVIQSLQTQCESYLQNAEAQMLELALEVTRKIVREELKLQPEHALAIVRDALRRVQGFTHIRIRVNPLDLELIRQNRAALLSVVDGIDGIEIVEDRRVDQGGCIIETEQGVYDARIRTQLGELERVMREAA